MSGQGGSTRHRIVQTESFRCIHNERNELSVSSSSMINSYLMALSSKVVRQTKAIWFSRVVAVVGWCARQSHYRPAQTIVAGNCIDWKGKKLRYKCRESFARYHCKSWSSNWKKFWFMYRESFQCISKRLKRKKCQFKTCWDDPGSLISMTSSNNRWSFVCVWKLISLIINYSFTN